MKINRRYRSKFLLLLMAAGIAVASGVSIDGRAAPYSGLSNVSGTNINTMTEIRIAGLTQAAAVYRQQHGLSSLPAGSTFRMTWPNGSSETGSVTSPYSSMGSVPVPGTQSDVPSCYPSDCDETEIP